MKVQNSRVILNNLPELNTTKLFLGEKINANVLKDLGNGYYLVKIKNAKIKIH
jgi:hypothetical protein